MDSTNQSAKHHWQQHVEAWLKSGLSGSQYCQQNALTYHQFIYWKTKLSERSPDKKTSAQGTFTKVIRQPESISDLTLTLPNGIVVGGITDTNVNLVGKIIEQL